ncbi:MAG: hypothetical protein QUS12_00855 [Methanosarcina sp.]|nr:hypothetical protein [Methanosarcina sp.]
MPCPCESVISGSYTYKIIDIGSHDKKTKSVDFSSTKNPKT